MNTYNPEGHPVQLGTPPPLDLEILRELAARCIADARDLDQAAEGVSHVRLANLFRGYAAERRRFALQLGNLFLAQGGNFRPSDEMLASWIGSLKQLWVDILELFSGGDEDVILSYCILNERLLSDSYVDALENNLPADVQNMLVDQLAAVDEAVEMMRKTGARWPSPSLQKHSINL